MWTHQMLFGEGRPICVLGMHRTGTSMVARMLHECGIYLGEPEDLMPAKVDDNREGYWENERIVRINDAILTAFGGTWDNPPPLPEGWTSAPRLAPMRAEAEKVVADLSKHGFWGWKDPRTCVTFAFWRELVPDVAVVLCVRHPFEVALSLAGRRVSYVPRDRAMRLWQDSYAAARAEIADVPHAVTRYVSFFYDPRAEFDRVLDLFAARPSEEQIEAAVASVDRNLWRGFSMDTPEFESRVPEEALTLYKELCQQAGPVYRAQMADAKFQAELRRTVMQKALDRIESLETISIERGEENERLRIENHYLKRWSFLHPGLSFRQRIDASRWLVAAVRRRLQRAAPAEEPATSSMSLPETTRRPLPEAAPKKSASLC